MLANDWENAKMSGFSEPNPKWKPLLAVALNMWRHPATDLFDLFADEVSVDVERRTVTVPVTVRFARNSETLEQHPDIPGWFEFELKKAAFSLTPGSSFEDLDDIAEEHLSFLNYSLVKKEADLHTRHRAGKAEIYARVGSPSALEFKKIPPDVFAHYVITDFVTGTATAKNGEGLYSIHVKSMGLYEAIDVLESQRERITGPFRHIIKALQGFHEDIIEEPSRKKLIDLLRDAMNSDGVKPLPTDKTIADLLDELKKIIEE